MTFQPPNSLKRTITKSKKRQGDNLTGDDLGRFERFWNAYPRKEGKKPCVKWWAKERPDDELLKVMLAKIEQARQKRNWKDQDGKFVPMPLTWLNEERWQDEYHQAAKQKERIPV